MDRDVSPRIAYWCSSFDPEMEALASEVALLRRAFPRSLTWGIAARDLLRLSRSHGFGVHPRFHLLFRAAAWVAQRCFDIQHLFGGLGDWFHLRAVRKNPIVMTIAVQSGQCAAALVDKVDRFVVEWKGAEDKLLSMGVEPSRIETILPPVDLDRFRPTPRPNGPLTIVFASSPDSAKALQARGVELLLDAARICPMYRFLLVWRPWGDSLPAVKRAIHERKLKNVELLQGGFADMPSFYARAHIGVAPFVDISRCKPMPNSMIESLACGRPVVVTRQVGLAPYVEKHRIGAVTETTSEALAAAFAEIEGRWDASSAAARQFAESSFGEQRFIEAYRQVYQRVAL
jgi:glycosyltransferase involved in cell wall biosynthesis